MGFSRFEPFLVGFSDVGGLLVVFSGFLFVIFGDLW